MKPFVVYVPELHYQAYVVEAETAKDAALEVYHGQGSFTAGGSEFERTMGVEDGFEELRVVDDVTGDETFQPIMDESGLE